MNIKVIRECGYEEAVLGFSLSYNSTIERTIQILPKYAFGVPGEGKFLEQMIIWVDVTAPRYWWQEADTYRVGTSKQSESTMHTLMKNGIKESMFEHVLPTDIITALQEEWEWLKTHNNLPSHTKLLIMKNMLPEGFLQRRIWMFSYKTLQNMYVQRKNHKLPQWFLFLDTVISNIEHPEFIIKKEEEE